MRIASSPDTTTATPHAVDTDARQSKPTTTTTSEEATTPAAPTTTARPEWGPTGFDGAARAKGIEPVAAPTTKTPKEVVSDFYTAFARKDGKAMTAAYAPNARFSDKVFPQLDGTKAGAMWRMLTGAGELKIRHEILKVDGDTVTAKWIANYPAPGTGRPVENHVTATIKVKDGQIVEHTDDFDMNKWVRMAFGGIASLPLMSGALAGITRHLAGRQLDTFIKKGG